MELKKQIETKKFKIIKQDFKYKARKIISKSYYYYLIYDNKRICLGHKEDIKRIFRTLLKDVYGDIYLNDVPNNFFKHYLHKEYLKTTRAIKKTAIKKKPYYKQLSTERRLIKIKRLEEEIKNPSNITTQQLKHKTESFK